MIDAVALRPLPYHDARQLVAVMEQHPERGMMAVTPANLLDWKDRVSASQDVTGLGGLEASVVAPGSAVRAIGTRVTERFFDLLGVTPALGRGLTAADFRSMAVSSSSTTALEPDVREQQERHRRPDHHRRQRAHRRRRHAERLQDDRQIRALGSVADVPRNRPSAAFTSPA